MVRSWIVQAALLVYGIGSVIAFYKNNLLVFALLSLGAAIELYLWHERKDVITFIAGAIVGPLSEIASVHFGVWSYANPSFLGIPIWLFPTWGFAILWGRRFVKEIYSGEGGSRRGFRHAKSKAK
ncbi:MAG: hypothetical protein KGH61_00130 [Candidatus Micrarchaeota archaeon]|nr:hypothetical protein [Candidatus Micrarchaeota archaeon]MDE1847344.1 hypothetical protein [Candidatus Micrarchaeota archaeon]MDE1863959.1 hypothetical protein [Candidatus Micrarchaeota archaeon]